MKTFPVKLYLDGSKAVLFCEVLKLRTRIHEVNQHVNLVLCHTIGYIQNM